MQKILSTTELNKFATAPSDWLIDSLDRKPWDLGS